jgi:hypothetical protein
MKFHETVIYNLVAQELISKAECGLDLKKVENP